MSVIHTNKNKRFTTLLILLLAYTNAVAQTNLVEESAKIQQAYKNAAYLSFDMLYTYAYETAPAVILDSSSGTFKLSGSNYWGTIDSTEFLQNSRYAVMVYMPGRLINVSVPRNVYGQVSGLAALDSMIGKKGYTSSAGMEGGMKVIALAFTDPGNPYKSFKVYYDAVSYVVRQITYTVKASYISPGEDDNELPGTNRGEYVIVKADYKNYRTDAFSDDIFNAGKYFAISDNTYRPVPPYLSYEVFIASPELSLTQQVH